MDLLLAPGPALRVYRVPAVSPAKGLRRQCR